MQIISTTTIVPYRIYGQINRNYRTIWLASMKDAKHWAQVTLSLRKSISRRIKKRVPKKWSFHRRKKLLNKKCYLSMQFYLHHENINIYSQFSKTHILTTRNRWIIFFFYSKKQINDTGSNTVYFKWCKMNL